MSEPSVDEKKVVETETANDKQKMDDLRIVKNWEGLGPKSRLYEEFGPKEAGSKKKKNKKKKKSEVSGGDDPKPELPLAEHVAKCRKNQSWPPAIPISKLFDERYPTGQEVEYGGANAYRSTSEEKREQDKVKETEYDALRRSAEVHRHARMELQKTVRPGIKLFDMCERLENTCRKLIEESKLDAGLAFPTGCSLNHVAAHYTPNAGDDTVLSYGDVMKVDFGVHVGGRLVDCAFTVAFDEQYDNLLLAAQDATNTGVKEAGIDARLGEIGAAIQEAMESYEVTINGKTKQVKSIRNLTGHSIGLYRIHAGKSVPIVAGGENQKMEEGEAPKPLIECPAEIIACRRIVCN
uniref:Peptidase M24 domain-containing protein n=1 Tax=Palpitomonas bilix TaxID=652834 RepID=A0A7S3DB73_9EUKA|mmetsp:Transcript_30110/g.77660  ORF Transcript_30110/g.77660 Transcript_30110/m.77660 type:complete len:351 (+) Transcript_30110:92-1144(+)